MARPRSDLGLGCGAAHCKSRVAVVAAVLGLTGWTCGLFALQLSLWRSQSFLHIPPASRTRLQVEGQGRRLLLASGVAAAGLLHHAPGDAQGDSRYVKAEKAYETANRLSYNPALSKIFDTVSKLYHDPNHRLVGGAASLLKDLPENFIVCMGEEHNHPIHHSAELRMLKALREHTPQHLAVALGLEMFDHGAAHKEALDDFVFGSDDLNDLKRRTNWDKNWGWPMSHWAKLLNYAKASKIRIVGLNAPLMVSDFVERNGVGGLLGRPHFPEIDLEDKAHLERFLRERPGRAAAEAQTELALANAYQAQTLREEWMAASVVSHARNTGGRILTIMGRNHVAGRHGVPNRIQRRLDGWAAPFTVLMCGATWDSKDLNLPNLNELPSTAEADWVWFTEHKKGCILH